MLRLGRERDLFKIVDDQVGAPTTSIELANATRAIVSGALGGQFGDTAQWAGLYHMTCSGSVSWCGFARAIFARAALLLADKLPEVYPISSDEYVTPAKRPHNSILSNDKLFKCFDLRLSTLETGLDRVIYTLATQNAAPLSSAK